MRRAVEAATTEEEIARIELQLQTGQFPFEQYSAVNVSEVVVSSPTLQINSKQAIAVDSVHDTESGAEPAKKARGRGRRGSEVSVESQVDAEVETQPEPVKGRRKRKSIEVDGEETTEGIPSAKVSKKVPVKKKGKK